MPNTKDTSPELISKLADESQELSEELLSAFTHLFSDILPEQLKSLHENWHKIKLSRKHDLLAHLKNELDNDVLLSYNALAHHLLKDEDAIIRAYAIRLLGEYEREDLLPTLLEIAREDPETDPREEAIKLLGIYIYYGELEEISPENLKKNEDALIKIAQNDQEKSVIRQRAIEALGFSSRKEVPALIEEAWNKDAFLWKSCALFAMGRSYNEIWEPQVLEALNNDNDLVRFWATKSAGDLSLQKARPILLEALKEEDDADIMDATIWALSAIGGEDVRTHLLALLDQYEEDEDEAIEYLEDALENLDFTEDVQNLDLTNFDYDTLDLLDED